MRDHVFLVGEVDIIGLVCCLLQGHIYFHLEVFFRGLCGAGASRPLLGDVAGAASGGHVSLA